MLACLDTKTNVTKKSRKSGGVEYIMKKDNVEVGMFRHKNKCKSPKNLESWCEFRDDPTSFEGNIFSTPKKHQTCWLLRQS